MKEFGKEIATVGIWGTVAVACYAFVPVGIVISFVAFFATVDIWVD